MGELVGGVAHAPVTEGANGSLGDGDVLPSMK